MFLISRVLLVVVSGILIAGCVPTRWTKPGATAEDFEQAKQQCQYEVDLHNQGQGANPFSILQLMPECLQAKGWRQER